MFALDRDVAQDALVDAITKILNVDTLDFDEFVKNQEKLVIISFIGVNGTNKTTTIAKLAQRLREQKYEDHRGRGHLPAGSSNSSSSTRTARRQDDRAAAGPGPGGRDLDAVQSARSNKKDLVLTDTAGRLHTNTNLIEQLKKISRVAQARPGHLRRRGHRR